MQLLCEAIKWYAPGDKDGIHVYVAYGTCSRSHHQLNEFKEKENMMLVVLPIRVFTVSGTLNNLTQSHWLIY